MPAFGSIFCAYSFTNRSKRRPGLHIICAERPLPPLFATCSRVAQEMLGQWQSPAAARAFAAGRVRGHTSTHLAPAADERLGMTKYKLEYIWLDGYTPTPNLRGKTQIKEYAEFPTLEQLPLWGFDGSSTMQAEGRTPHLQLWRSGPRRLDPRAAQLRPQRLSRLSRGSPPQLPRRPVPDRIPGSEDGGVRAHRGRARRFGRRLG